MRAKHSSAPASKHVPYLTPCGMCVRVRCAAGSFIATMPVIVGDIVGDEDLPAALGFAYGCQVASVLLGAPAAGWLFNGTGTYAYSWCLAGGTVVGGAAMLLGIDQSKNRGQGGRGSASGCGLCSCMSGGRAGSGRRLVSAGKSSSAVVPLSTVGQVGAPIDGAGGTSTDTDGSSLAGDAVVNEGDAPAV